MAVSVFLHGSRKLPVLNSTVSKLLSTQFKSSQLVFTPILAKNFCAFNRTVQDTKQINGINSQITQARMLSHSAIWTAEKLVSVALLGIIPGCLAIGSPVADNILAVTVVLHMHWGIEAVVVDYVRPSLVGNVIPQISRAFVYLMSALTLGGLLYFNYNDIGISKAVRRLWAIKPSNN